MNNKKIGLLFGGMLCALSANASVTGYSPGVEQLIDPAGYNAGWSGGTENDMVVVFEEQYSFKLGSDLVTDTATTSAGTYVGSYLVNYNPADIPGDHEQNHSGVQQISFSDQILGVIFSTDTLYSTDSTLGHDGVTYGNENYQYRGLEKPGVQDHYFLLENNTSLMSFRTSGGGIDQMRIITAAPVPLPAAVWMFGAGIIALAGFSRRSANKSKVAIA